MKLLLPVLTIFLAVFPQTGITKQYKHNDRIQVQYDKFKDLTSVVLYRMRPGLNALGDLPKPFQKNQIDISLITNYSGKNKPTQFNNSLLLSLRFEPNWPEYTLPDLILLIDGRRQVLQAQRGALPSAREEQRYEARITLPFHIYDRVRNAKTVEGQFGAIEFHLDPDNFEAIRDFDSRLRP